MVVPNVMATEPLSLEPVAALPELEELRVGPVRSAAPLARATNLRRAHLGAVADGDLRPLIGLPGHVVVDVGHDAQRRELQRARPPLT
ncbi:hypothetical protein ABT369_28455 [Dactylosporangium sp. NPDC000244]|uniref:hypothetical protein n=1 Tax=Dactylosporangium sp. NPDC000244 TaxID=3154365 RepID=UPI00332FA29F